MQTNFYSSTVQSPNVAPIFLKFDYTYVLRKLFDQYFYKAFSAKFC